MANQPHNNKDPFADAEKLLSDIQAKHKQLSDEIPSLTAAKKLADRDLADVQRLVVETQTRLEDLQKTINENVEKYNTWQNWHLKNLEKKKAEFETNKAAATNQVQTKFAEAQALLEHAQELIVKAGKDQSKANEQRRDLDEKVDANLKWADRLAIEAEETRTATAKADERSAALDNREKRLDKREKEIAPKETAASKALQEAEQARDDAKAMLVGASDRVARMDARADDLNHRERMLNNRTKALKERETAIEKRMVELKKSMQL